MILSQIIDGSMRCERGPYLTKQYTCTERARVGNAGPFPVTYKSTRYSLEG